MSKAQENGLAGDRSQTVNIRDVGQRAGVSYQTVSRVINGSPNVSDETRAKVLAAIEALDFRPNRAARALAGGSLYSVTVLTPNTTRYGFAAAIEGIEEACRIAGFDMGLRTVDHLRVDDLRTNIEYAIGLTGAVVVIAFDEYGVRALEQVPEGIPTVALIQAPREGITPRYPSVWIDERQAAYEATKYLLSLGHQTVHHIPIPAWPSTPPRQLGWQAALVEAGVTIPELPGPGLTTDWGFEVGTEFARRSDVTAILCGNDDIALGLIAAMREAGRDVPGEISVVGFDDIPYARYFSPPLTTVRQDFRALGRCSINLVAQVLGVKPAIVDANPPTAELVLRASAVPPAKGGGGTARSPPASTGG